MKVYVCCLTEYEDEDMINNVSVEEVFSTQNEAEKYCAEYNEDTGKDYYYWYVGREVK